MKKETRKKVVERLCSIEAHLDELITLLENRLEQRKQTQARREAS